MSGFANQRLIPANTTLLQPGSRNFRLNDALNTPTAGTVTQISVLQGQVGTLQTQVATLQSQIATLQAQVAAQQVTINSFSYLQAEVSTGTVFLDTRTIYKRSFVINGALSTALTVFTFALAIPNINYIVNIQAMAAQAGGQQLPITFLNMAQAPSLGTGLSIWADAANLYISVGNTTFAGFQVLATLWYTATDR